MEKKKRKRNVVWGQQGLFRADRQTLKKMFTSEAIHLILRFKKEENMCKLSSPKDRSSLSIQLVV